MLLTYLVAMNAKSAAFAGKNVYSIKRGASRSEVEGKARCGSTLFLDAVKKKQKNSTVLLGHRGAAQTDPVRRN